MPGHEFHSKFLSRNQKAEKFREDGTIATTVQDMAPASIND